MPVDDGEDSNATLPAEEDESDGSLGGEHSDSEYPEEDAANHACRAASGLLTADCAVWRRTRTRSIVARRDRLHAHANVGIG